MSGLLQCPVCIERSASCDVRDGMGDMLVSCNNCGRFKMRDDTYDDLLDPSVGQGHRLTHVQRARISHWIRRSQADEKGAPWIEYDALERFIGDGTPGPTPTEQVANIVRYIADQMLVGGARLSAMPPYLFALVGAPSPEMASELVSDLIGAGLVSGSIYKPVSGSPIINNIGLTLAGWEQYEKIRTGKFSGKTGFIAMKFGDTVLDPLVRDLVKPAISSIGYQLVDMRDISQAGVIDNIMRAQIRDSAFVLVDLTHDNSGA